MNLNTSATLVLVAAFLAGCGSTPETAPEQTDPRAGLGQHWSQLQRPVWFDPAETATEADGHIYGYGLGENANRRLAIQSAKAEARRGIASYIATETTGLFEESIQDMGNGDAVETARATYEEFVRENIHGAIPDRNALFRDDKTGDYRAFYRLRVDAELANEMLEQSLDDEDVSAMFNETTHEEAVERMRQRRQESESTNGSARIIETGPDS